MSDNRRLLRVEREVREIIARYLQAEMREPLPPLSSVVHVDVTRDLRSARIFVQVPGPESVRDEAMESLERDRAQMQKQVARSLQVKFCPVLKFVVGEAPHDPDEVDQLLANLRDRRS